MTGPIFLDPHDKQVHQWEKEGKLIDTFESQVDELCEAELPHLRDSAELEKQKKLYQKKYNSHAVYCYLPWKDRCFRLLGEEEFLKVKTARNKNLITASEQEKFYHSKIAIAGLSVGSNIALACALQGGGKYTQLADFDTISLSNTNRTLFGIAALGQKKTEVLAEMLYEMNPFLQLQLFSDGVQASNIDDFLGGSNGPVQIIIDEIDTLEMKILLRKKAVGQKIPLVSVVDNGEGVIVDVERYDKDYNIDRFLQKISSLPSVSEEALSISQKAIAITKFIGVEDVETAMLQTVLEVGKTIFSWPQLGGTALLSGVFGAFVIRSIATDAFFPSGRYRFSLADFFSHPSQRDLKKRSELLNYFV